MIISFHKLTESFKKQILLDVLVLNNGGKQSNDSRIANYDYAYDAFKYDARSQVTNSIIATNIFSHAYDEIGNHVSDGATPITNNSLNQTTSFGNELITWNADGGMASDDKWFYAYDAEDRLISVTSRAFTNGAIRVRNEYDYRNRRISKSIDHYDSIFGDWHLSECHDFVWDDWNIIHETVSAINGGITNLSEIQYFWGNDLSDTLQGAGGVGDLLAVSLNDQFYFPVYDNNGNVMKYVDELGVIIVLYLYDDFGAMIFANGNYAEAFNFGFSTKYCDDEIGLVAHQLRNYNLTKKCWLNRDPIEEDDGENLYEVCGNNFFIFFDCLGNVKIPMLNESARLAWAWSDQFFEVINIYDWEAIIKEKR